MAQWYYTKNGQQAGPVEDEQLRGLIASGQVGPSEMVWKDGMANWQAASTVPELGSAAIAPQYQGQVATAQQGQQLNYGGYTQQQQYAPGSVPNYLVQSILVTLFCCMPFGIVSIIFAAQVNSKLATGDYAGAIDASKKAKMFSWIGVVIWLVAVVGYIIIIALSAAMSR